jgi:hypothetical protein
VINVCLSRSLKAQGASAIEHVIQKSGRCAGGGTAGEDARTQILGVNYFESFSPVASFVTIRTLFALTALPMFKVYQYDVQVAFIQSVDDPNHPPVYCEPAKVMKIDVTMSINFISTSTV